MPNHVTHRLVVGGPPEDVALFRATHIVDAIDDHDGKPFQHFDFNTVVPMAEGLRIDSGSETTLGLTALGVHEPGSPFRTTFAMQLDWELSIVNRHWNKGAPIVDVAGLLAWCEEHRPEALATGRQAARNIAEHGHATWYSWSIEKWGTKWSSYSYEEISAEPTRFEFKFDTAWSHPEPIFRALAARYPRLSFNVQCVDEGWNFAGEGSYRGDFCSFSITEDQGRIRELLTELRGWTPDEDEDEAPIEPGAHR